MQRGAVGSLGRFSTLTRHPVKPDKHQTQNTASALYASTSAVLTLLPIKRPVNRANMSALVWMALFSMAALAPAAQEGGKAAFRPGQVWLDSAGRPINAHGGGVLFHDGIYYWYGTHKIEGLSEAKHADGGVHAYASRDLIEWHNLGMVLPLNGREGEDLRPGCNFDRPKVVFNGKTGEFVLFFKFYPAGQGTQVGFVGVATSRSPSGPFVYRHKFLGADSPEGSGDFAMFKDDNGELYHLTVRKPDRAFVIGKMRDDYLLPEGRYHEAEGITKSTEAPAVLKHEGRYWLLGSGSTGWAPNAARSFSADNILGPWVDHGNPCEGTNPHNGLGKELTFGGQAASIVEVQGRERAFIAFFDINKPEHPYESLYIWLPVSFEDGRMQIRWRDQWSLEHFSTTPEVRE